MSVEKITDSPEDAARGSSAATLLDDLAGYVVIAFCKIMALAVVWSVDAHLVLALVLWRLGKIGGEIITERQEERSSNDQAQRP